MINKETNLEVMSSFAKRLNKDDFDTFIELLKTVLSDTEINYIKRNSKKDIFVVKTHSNDNIDRDITNVNNVSTFMVGDKVKHTLEDVEGVVVKIKNNPTYYVRWDDADSKLQPHDPQFLIKLKEEK